MINLIKLKIVKEREEKIEIILKDKISARVAIVLDISGSMKSLYESGKVQDIIERIYPIARNFSTKKEMDIWFFSSEYVKGKPVNDNNFDTYIENNVLSKSIPCAWMGTNYAPVIKSITKEYSVSNGVLSLFSKIKHDEEPRFVIFITDGENNDRIETTKRMVEASSHRIFWQFVGIGRSSYHFLEKLDTMTGRVIDNANFFQVNKLEDISDEILYSLLLKEFPGYIKESERMGIR